MLSTDKISCGYDGIDVVKNISFQCKKGDCISIVGPNGCGKTTFLRALSGLLPYSGSVKLNEKEISSLGRRQISSEIALMTQISSTYFSYSVYETVAFGRYLHMKQSLLSSMSKDDESAVLSCLEDVDLLDIKDKEITTLSGGQLQRVYLARVFAQEPKVILLDEPTNHLDLRYQLELVERLKQWVHDGDRAIIGVFHDLNLSMQLSEKTLLMNNGEEVAFGNTKEILLGEKLKEVYGLDIKEYMQKSFYLWK